MSHSLSLTKSDPIQALMASLCGFGFHYSEISKRGEGEVDRWIDGRGMEGTRGTG